MRYFFGTLRYFPSLAFSSLMAEAQKPIEVHCLEMDRWGWFDSTAKQTHTQIWWIDSQIIWKNCISLQRWLFWASIFFFLGGGGNFHQTKPKDAQNISFLLSWAISDSDEQTRNGWHHFCYPKNPDPSKVAILRTNTPLLIEVQNPSLEGSHLILRVLNDEQQDEGWFIANQWVSWVSR